MEKPIKVLVVDDSALMRLLISDILRSTADIEVVGTARDGIDALEKMKRLRPHVITLDVEMPRLDGLATLERIMGENPVPVVMLSSLTTRGAETTLKALELGAIDFVAKPGLVRRDAAAALQLELPLKVKTAAGALPRRAKQVSAGSDIKNASFSGPLGKVPQVVVIGTSTGGPSALGRLLSRLPSDFPVSILVAQHMPPGFTRYLAQRLDATCSLRVREAEGGEPVEPGVVLIAPAGSHLHLQGRGNALRVEVTPGGKDPYRPSVDILFRSAGETCGSRVLALILTGMGYDGRQGLEVIKGQGGYVLAESQETCIVYGMPRAAVQAGLADEVLPLYEMGPRVLELVGVGGN